MKTSKPRKKEVYNNEIHKTLCTTCHKTCEVPFKPNGLKPVFCDTCFKHTKEVVSGDYIKRKDKTVFNTPENFVQPMNPLTPVYGPSQDIKIAELKRELSSANAKLDKLIDMFSKMKGK